MKNNYPIAESKPNSYYAATRTEMLKYIPSSTFRFLDVGCGEGYFGNMIKNYKTAEVWGVEIYQKAAEIASKKIDKVVFGNYETDSLSLPQHYFDCIFFNDVLEHFINPWEILEITKEYLANGGYIIASLPNMRFLYAMKSLIFEQNWKYCREGILDKTHLRFFTFKSAKDLFNEKGYFVHTLEGIRGIEFPIKFRFFNFMFGGKFSDMKYERFVIVAQLTI